MIIISASVITTFLRHDFMALCNGYSTLWLSFLYIIGAYIKKYKPENNKCKRYLVGYAVCIIISFISFVAISLLTHKVYGQIKGNLLFIRYVSPFILISAISLLMFFSSIKIRNKILVKIIKLAAPSTLGVYIIHEYPLCRYILGKLEVFAAYPVIGMVLSVIAAVFAVYIICTLIDILRIQLFKILKINELSMKIYTLFRNIFEFCMNKIKM